VAIAPNGVDTYVTGAYEEGTTKGSLSVISTATNAAVAQIALPESPVGPIAIAPNGKTAYLIAFQDVIPVHLATDIAATPIPTPITGGGGDLGIAVTPNGKTAYVPTSELGPCTSATTCYGSSCASTSPTTLSAHRSMSPTTWARGPTDTKRRSPGASPSPQGAKWLTS
jgi:DNA-binding beta-propeller fold protein YncE